MMLLNKLKHVAGIEQCITARIVN